MDNKTIYALSTLFGKSGIAVIRVSGKNAFAVIEKMTEIDAANLISRKMYFTQIFDAVSRETLDNALVVAFKNPQSFTGEDTVEINCHGSKAVIRSVLASLAKLPDFRLAEAGEFSRRAFYNGKMDLTKAEGLADLIDAETALQRKVALQQMGGTLLNLYENWRERLLSTLSYIEAYIDFPEENIPHNTVVKIENSVFKIMDEIERHITDNNIEERLRDGFRVVIAGEPNAGKSSLINAIVKRNVAIVSDVAGTTRDVIDAYVDLRGFPVVFSDTAGLRDGGDEVERIGIELAKEKIMSADFKIFIFDAKKGCPHGITPYLNDNEYLLVANKSDTLSEDEIEELSHYDYVLASAKKNINIDIITDKIYEHFKELYVQGSSGVITRQRYKEALQECVENLQRFNLRKEIELAAEDIRLACRAIGKITGKVEVNEVLDKIFSNFCIGK